MDDDLSLASRLGWETLVGFETFGQHSIAVASSTPSDKALLLLHGFPSSSWDYHKLWPSLAKTHTLIAPDFLGFGLSDKPTGHRYSIMEQADICEAVLNARAIKHIDILAHDYGDTVAQELLARAGEGSLGVSVGKTIMLNGGILPEAHRPLPIQSLLAGPLGPMLSKLLTKRRFKQSFSAIFGPKTQPVDAELNMVWDFLTHNNGHRIAHTLLRYLAERREQRERWVPPILTPQGPLLLINGSKDPISGKHMMDAYRRLGGKAEIIELAEIGHYPQLEAAEVILSVITHFLD
ncbi:MAG: alpha/beta hydrolase [Pseudomonadota bacterium]